MTPRLSLGSLFSSIGLLDLAVELVTGGQLVYQCEIDPWRRRVLARHWPHVLRGGDVREFHPPDVDLICGGFPCQDVSYSGKVAGLDGARSGLWSEYARIIEETAPRFAFIENVGALERRGLERVLRELDRLGYQTRRGRLAASDVGATHGRDRIWILAFRDDADRRALADAVRMPGDTDQQRQAEPDADPARDHRARSMDDAGGGRALADAAGQRRQGRMQPEAPASVGRWLPEPATARAVRGVDDAGGGRALADADEDRRQGRGAPHDDDGRDASGHDDARRRAAVLLAHPDHPPGRSCSKPCIDGRCDPAQHERWARAWHEWIERNPGCEPGIRRAPHGSPARLVDRGRRNAALGDAVCVHQAAAALVGLLTSEPEPAQIGLWSPE